MAYLTYTKRIFLIWLDMIDILLFFYLEENILGLLPSMYLIDDFIKEESYQVKIEIISAKDNSTVTYVIKIMRVSISKGRST